MRWIRTLWLSALFIFIISACGGSEQSQAKPTAPTSVFTSAQSGAIVVTWTDNSVNEQGFRIRRQTITELAAAQGSSEIVGEVGPNVTRFEDSDVSAAQKYRYFVSAFNGAGESLPMQQTSPDVSPVPKVLTLNVALTGDGAGTVGSSPAGIDCGSECSALYPEGATVFLSATPATGSTFVAWTGDCSGKSLTCSVQVDDNLMVTAEFAELPPAPIGKETLSVSKSGSGTGTVVSEPAGIDCGGDCVANFDAGTTVILTAIPTSGTVFGGWQGHCSGSGTSCEVTMSASRSVTAQFVARYEVSVVRSGSGSGTVGSTPPGINCGQLCSADFAEGTELTLEASPAAGSTFVGWAGGGCSGSEECTLTVAAVTNIDATFDSVPMDLVVSVQGPGSVSSSPAGIDCGDDCSAPFDPDTKVSLTATPSSGAEFLGWDGACGGTNSPCVITMNTSKSVTANFGTTAIVVDSTVGTVGGPDCTLRAAIEAANTDSAVGGCRAGSGVDVIRLPSAVTFPLLQSENNTNGNNALPSITSRITIQGNGSTIARGDIEPKFRIFHVAESGYLTIENLTIRNGDGGNFGGGGFYVAGGELELIGSVVTENHAAHAEDGLGAGILSVEGTVSIQSSEISDNENALGDYFADGTGTAITSIDGDLTVRDSDITGNTSGYTAGILLLGEFSTADIKDSRIAGNQGLGLENEGALWMTNVVFSGNSLAQGAGGMSNSGTAYLDRITYTHNSGEGGGSLRNSGTMEISNSLIHRNWAGEYGTGGGITNSGKMEIRDSEITDNSGADSIETGGGIDNSGELLITGSTIGKNTSNEGGGIWNTGDLRLVDTVVDDNQAFGHGGGVFNLGSVSLEGSTVIGGSVGNTSSYGAGISSGFDWESSERTTISLADTSSITNNRATEDGGGIYAHDHLTLSLCDTCRITGNVADSDNDGGGEGGGIYGTDVYFYFGNASQVYNNSPDDLAPGGTIRVRVNQPQDDAEEFRSATEVPPLPAGSVYFDSQDLEFTFDPDSELDSDQYVGIRFPNLQIPQDARIVSAYIQFTTDEVGSGNTDVRIYLQNSPNPAWFEKESGNYGISTRPRTTSYSSWSPRPWTFVNEAGSDQRTPDMSHLIQQMVDRRDWQPGNALAFIFTGDTLQTRGATRTAFAYDGDPSKAPQLVIGYFDQ